MNDTTLADLIRALNIMVLERVDTGVFTAIGTVPHWFAPTLLDGGYEQDLIRPGTKSLFLAHFLVDAETFWDGQSGGELRSGPWSEQTEDGKTGLLEAVACFLGARRVMYIRKLGTDLREKMAVLQRARENRLAYERLESAQKALRQSEARNRALIGRLEASNANLVVVLDQLRIGTLLLDQQGRVLFMNRSAQRILGCDQKGGLGEHWSRIWPFPQATRSRLQEMLASPPQARSRISTSLSISGKRHYWMEIDAHDDPRDPERKILFLYDLSEVQDLRRLIEEHGEHRGLIGSSEPMLKVLQEIDDLGRLDTTVLIDGETGTGKELVARELHAVSRRKNKPFIGLNCAGLNESLLASQLFGHKRGAFTGAVSDHKGVFEAAEGGTLFLDEVGDMPPAVQANLLRVLQEREIVRLGETTARRIDVRILAATHRNLQAEVDKGNFRADLLYRIRVARIQLPPLRQRPDDIPVLVSTFLQHFRKAIGKPVEVVSLEAMRLLQACRWPGNVRELRSAIEFAVIRCRGAVIQPEDLPAEISDVAEPVVLPQMLPQDERELLLAALERTGGNRTAAARMLGISRATFYRRLADFDIPRNSGKAGFRRPRPLGSLQAKHQRDE